MRGFPTADAYYTDRHRQGNQILTKRRAFSPSRRLPNLLPKALKIFGFRAAITDTQDAPAPRRDANYTQTESLLQALYEASLEMRRFPAIAPLPDRPAATYSISNR
jgi:hypothetical protein